jgi:hypothetical protein
MPAKNPIAAVPIAAANREVEGLPQNLRQSHGPHASRRGS